MIVKGTKQLGNFKRGVNLYIPKRRSAAAPSGLSASSTGNLRITFADQTNGLGTKYSATYWSDYLGDGNENILEWTGTIWRLRRIESGDTTGIDYPFPAEATNDTSTSATIPTTGWVYTISSQYFNNSIVITAAWWTLNCYLLIV